MSSMTISRSDRSTGRGLIDPACLPVSLTLVRHPGFRPQPRPAAPGQGQASCRDLKAVQVRKGHAQQGGGRTTDCPLLDGINGPPSREQGRDVQAREH